MEANDTKPQYTESEVFKLVSTHEINPKLCVHVYDCLALDGRVFGLKHAAIQDEMLITEETFRKLAEELHL